MLCDVSCFVIRKHEVCLWSKNITGWCQIVINFLYQQASIQYPLYFSDTFFAVRLASVYNSTGDALNISPRWLMNGFQMFNVLFQYVWLPQTEIFAISENAKLIVLFKKGTPLPPCWISSNIQSIYQLHLYYRVATMLILIFLFIHLPLVTGLLSQFNGKILQTLM